MISSWFPSRVHYRTVHDAVGWREIFAGMREVPRLHRALADYSPISESATKANNMKPNM